MPIIVKDYEWTQSEQSVLIIVPLHGVPQCKADVFVSDEYVKASFGQFFFECYLYDRINLEEGRTMIKKSEIVFQLVKSAPGQWSKLQKELTKAERMAVKVDAIAKQQEQMSQQQKAIKEKMCDLQRESVRMAVAEDTQRRKVIADTKENEKNKALGDLTAWSNQLKAAIKDQVEEEEEEEGEESKIVPEVKKTRTNVVPLPLPRNRGEGETEVGVDFTPRVFPTPSRESCEADEREWLAKQAEARRNVGFVAEDLRPEEKSPMELLDKGRRFMRKKNYLGALSALSYAIKLSPNYVDLHILRSEAHFEKGNFHKCAIDCSTALEIMKPECYANLNQRVECIHRRGKALFRLGLKSQAMSELEAAWKLQPSDALMQDLREVSQAPEMVEKDVAGLKETDL